MLVACGSSAPRSVPSNHGGAAAPDAVDDLEIRPTGLRADDYRVIRRPRTITVTSKYAATVLLDGKSYGITPVRIDLPPGHHVLELWVAGY